MRATVSKVTRYSPGQLAFGHDMIIQITIIVHWEYLKDKHRQSSRIANDRENKGRIEKVYKKGDKMLIVLDRMDRGAKLNSPTEGPYEIFKVYTNGTIKIRRKTISRTSRSQERSHSTNKFKGKINRKRITRVKPYKA